MYWERAAHDPKPRGRLTGKQRCLNEMSEAAAATVEAFANEAFAAVGAARL
jgi:hypothetical protein